MDLEKLFFDPEEKPLDRIVNNGGFCGIFRTIGCVGDSMSSGEFETLSDEGISGWHDFYEYSWGQYMARNTGTKVYNFSKGGMTAKWFMESFARECGAWSTPCQAYIIALGANDINYALNNNISLGGTEEINTPSNETFAGAYTNIILNLKRRQPDAKFFLVTLPVTTNPKEEIQQQYDRQAEIIYEIAEKYKNCYVIDLRKYAPAFDKEFEKKFHLRGHLNPMGYKLISLMIESYMDYIIRHNMEDFSKAGLIGTQLHNV